MADNTDPYGVDLAIDPDSGDLIAWPNGALAVKDGADNVVQALYLWIKTTPGEVPLHPDFGSAFANGVIGGKFNIVGIEGLARAEFKNILANDNRLLSVSNVTVVENDAGDYGPAANVSATVYLVGGESVEVLDFAQGVFSTLTDNTDVDPTPVDPLDDPTFFADQPEYDDLADVDTLASAVEDLDAGVITPSDFS